MNLTIPTRWRESVEAGLGLLYPDVCQLCEKERATQGEGYVCEACRSQLKFIQEPYCDRCGLPFEGALTTVFECANCKEMKLDFAFARAVVAAEGVALEVIHRYKYQRALWFEPFLATLLLEHAVPVLQSSKWDLIVPVPLHSLKEREREFNQATRLARHLGKALQLPVRHRLLKRTVATRTQTRLTRSERAENVAGAFEMRAATRLNGERVILIDDVLTTGATTSACASVLKKSGAGEVCVWTVARGLKS